MFISHAGEDKDAIARPLAEEFRQRGFSVWFDEFELVVGDRLSERIDDGLARSRFGVVILSRAFMSKPWPKRELLGLVARETGGGEELILPVWHGVSEPEVRAFSPPLAGVYAVSSERGVMVVVEAIATAIERRRVQEATADREPAGAPVRDARADHQQRADMSGAAAAAQPDSPADPGGSWEPRPGGEAFVLSSEAGPLVAHLRNGGRRAAVERAGLRTALGRFSGTIGSNDPVEPDDDLVIRFGEGELGGLLQANEPLILTIVFRLDGGDERWEQRIQLLRDGSAATGGAKWRAGAARLRREGGL